MVAEQDNITAKHQPKGLRIVANPYLATSATVANVARGQQSAGVYNRAGLLGSTQRSGDGSRNRLKWRDNRDRSGATLVICRNLECEFGDRSAHQRTTHDHARTIDPRPVLNV